jgi:hypothetical protein
LSVAILAGICQQEQISHQCQDLSLRIWQRLPTDFHAIDEFCITGRIEPDVEKRLQQLIDLEISQVIQQQPNTVFALSLLSYWSIRVCEMVCDSIRRQSSCKILIGGQGLYDHDWVRKMQQQHRIDHYIIGEGEIPFRAFLQGQTQVPGLDNFDYQQIDDLDVYCVIPDYSKLPIDQYPYLDGVRNFYITASRGCVRRCGYCDVEHQWKKYRYRSADHVAQEMIAQYERHGVQEFFFTDSLINGSMKMLDELCDRLIEYKTQNPAANFRWKGQYIFRPKELVKESHIEKMARAGVSYLIVGLETGSDRVRFDMDKKHTTDDAEWFLEQFKRHGISCHLLMLTGWVTETLEDHAETMSLFGRWQKYVASGTITGVELGSTLAILEHSPVGRRMGELEISMINSKEYLWYSAKNPDLTIHERFRRRVETHKEAMRYHWPITRGQYRLETIKRNFLEAVEYLQHNPMPRARSTFKIVNANESIQTD